MKYFVNLADYIVQIPHLINFTPPKTAAFPGFQLFFVESLNSGGEKQKLREFKPVYLIVLLMSLKLKSSTRPIVKLVLDKTKEEKYMCVRTSDDTIKR